MSPRFSEADFENNVVRASLEDTASAGGEASACELSASRIAPFVGALAGRAYPLARVGWAQRVGRLAAFLAGYVLFGTVGVLTSLAAFALALVFRSPKAHLAGQGLIHGLFSFFVWFVRACGLLNLQAEDLAKLRSSQGLILAANHPSLLDAVFIAAYLPRMFCLMKANLLHNVVLCGQAKLAGYVANRSGVGLIKTCHARLREGSNLLVFPEGTRTRSRLGNFKMGFALLACAANVPIQTILIHYDCKFLGKGRPFFKPPPFPLNCTISLGKRFTPTPEHRAQALGEEIEHYFRETLDRDPRAPGSPP